MGEILQPPRRWRGTLTALSVTLAGCAVVLVSASFLIGSTPDEEEFRFAILTSWLYVRALVHGDSMFWTSLLGLGVPLPLTPNFLLHPLLPLLAVVGPVAWARLLLLSHTLLGAAGMWQLTRALRLTPLVRAACVITFLLATPAQNYALADFWPSHYVVWTSSPWLMLLAWRVLDVEGRPLRWWSVALGVSVGLVVANTNPGHVVVYATAVVAFAAIHWRRIFERWRWIAAAGLLTAAIASPNLIQLVRERQVFDPDLRLATLRDALPPSAAWTALLAPAGPPQPWLPPSDLRFARTLFFGGPFIVLCLVACVQFARHHLGLVLTVAISGVLLFTPALSLPFVSARYQFRDPLTLAGILLAGLTADRLLATRKTRFATVLLLALQLGVVVAAALPALQRTWAPRARAAMWFRGATGGQAPVEILLNLMPVPGRLVFSPRVDDEIRRGMRLRDGFGVNALAYRGVPVVNGWFKGVSTDALWPDERMFYGRILVPRQIVESENALTVLGVRYVLANADETVAPGLRERGLVPSSGGAPLVVHENSTAWPEAVVLGEAADRIELDVVAGCGNSRLLCRDFAPLARRRPEAGVRVTRQGGQIDVQRAVAGAPGLLLVNQMFRRDWVATGNGRRLAAVPVFGGLLGVRLPPGITSVQLRYRPVTLEIATVLAWCALLGSLAVLVFWRRDRREAPG